MIHKTVSSITQNANGFMNIVFYTIEFVFLTALFLLLLFAHGFYRPLHRLTIVSESYAKGNFEPRTQIHRNDELGYLANTMDIWRMNWTHSKKTREVYLECFPRFPFSADINQRIYRSHVRRNHSTGATE